MSTEIIPENLLDDFDTRGFVILPNFFTADIVAAAQAAIETLVDEHATKLVAAGKANATHADAAFETRWYQLHEHCLTEAADYLRAELHLEDLFGVFFHPRLLDIVETVLGNEIRLYPNYTVRPKLPNHEPTAVLWHQDGGYTEHWHKANDGDVADIRMLNVWSPLVPARVENGCMQFIPGSHKLPLLPHEEREFYLEIPPEHIEPLAQDAVAIELDPGDVVLFHNMLCHRGLSNQAKTIRWSMDWRYQDARQPTLRKENGHLAKSLLHPNDVVQSASEWASLTFG